MNLPAISVDATSCPIHAANHEYQNVIYKVMSRKAQSVNGHARLGVPGVREWAASDVPQIFILWQYMLLYLQVVCVYFVWGP